MEPDVWLIIDANYVAHRSYHTMGELSFNDIATGTIFGFFQHVTALKDLFCTEQIIFCFDSRKSKRLKLLPTYKSSRRQAHAEYDEEKKAAHLELYRQIDDLCEKHLPALGFANVFRQDGYESDDLIAAVCQTSLPKGDFKIIVSADKDLWQCLNEVTTCYNPQTKQSTTAYSFQSKWGVYPSQWPDVKAIAGCPTDDIDGIKGVGEVSAAKYLLDKLKKSSDRYKDIESNEGQALWRFNLQLTTLPMEGCIPPTIGKDTLSKEKWDAFAQSLGFKKLRSMMPIGERAYRKKLVGRA